MSAWGAREYADAVFRGLWESSGGVWRGQVHNGIAPTDAKRLAQHESKPLAEVIRDINKYSNNVMARQLFLTIGAESSRRPANADELLREARKSRGHDAIPTADRFRFLVLRRLTS